MRRLALTGALLLLAPALVAQGNAPPKPANPEAAAAYEQLARDFDKAIGDWNVAMQAAFEKAKADGTEPQRTAPPTKDFIKRAQDLAAQYADSDDAVQFLGFVIKNASEERSAVQKAVGLLQAMHATSPQLVIVMPHLAGATRFGATKQVLGLCDEVAANHPDADCKAHAMLARSTIRLQSRNEAERKAAAEDLRAIATVTKDADLIADAKAALFEIEHLQVGCTAPDIAGVDVEGKAIKLSDYRGKVVLLDFWGFW
jgi:hypothetical protein